MAVVELDIGREATASSEDLELADGPDVRLDVHDASRFEWSVSLPLPTRGDSRYTIEISFEIPANVFAQHSPWDQLQSWTRLDASSRTPGEGEAVTIDGLRRGAVGFAHRLARASEGFSRHCRLAGALSASSPAADLEEGLDLWIAVATATAGDARRRLALARAPRESAELARERALVDEYVSIRLLEMLAAAERSLGVLAESRSAFAVTYRAAIVRAEARLAAELEREVLHRAERDYVRTDVASPKTLERYLERASRLKKHFQEVLFLEPETFQVADRIHHWVAAFVALVASTWAFLWQIALMNRQPTTGTQIGSGVFVFAVIAGLVYAGKDRIKELGRAWISGNVHRFYAQRVARWRAPAKRMPKRDVVVRARESFDQAVSHKPDPLNPDCGASVASTLVCFVHRGHLIGHPALGGAGVHRVKHIFRYDLSPLFARLDDAVKQVPVLDAQTRRVKFTDAPRCYRVPVRVTVRAAGEVREEVATLVLHKRGLERLEREGDHDHGRLETGVLPS